MEHLTEEKLMSFIRDLMASPVRPNHTIMFTPCVAKGLIMQNLDDVSLCDNPDCKACRNIEKALKDQGK